MGEVVRFAPKSELERARLIREARAIYESIFPDAEGPGSQICVIHATANGLRDNQRPSRNQVAANAPSSSSSPISPANTGSTPTPLTTLASRIRTPIQPSP
jgi:hypothetical protein